MKKDTDRYALLIDAENISDGYIETVMEEVADKGEATIRRIYGNWTGPSHQGWKELLLDYSITPVQQFSYTAGKNATDSALIIDAMDILYTGNVDGFVLVSSDSDFTKLASRLRESGMRVIGMGEQKTPSAFVKACTEFKFLDRIGPEIASKKVAIDSGSSKKKAAKPEESYKKAINRVIDQNSDDEGWVQLSLVVVKLKNQFPEFSHKNYGYSKATEYMKSLGYRIKEEKDENNKKSPNGKIVYIKRSRRCRKWAGRGLNRSEKEQKIRERHTCSKRILFRIFQGPSGKGTSCRRSR